MRQFQQLGLLANGHGGGYGFRGALPDALLQIHGSAPQVGFVAVAHLRYTADEQ